DASVAARENSPGPESASRRARVILDRPEFQEPVPRKAKAKQEEEKKGENAWDRFWRRLGEWLRDLLRPRPVNRPDKVDLSPGGGEVVANALAVALVAGVLIALAVLILRRRRRGGAEGEAALDVVTA